MINALRSTVVAAVLLLLPFSVSAAPKHLTILHFNDIHGHLEAEADGGGAARIAAIVRATDTGVLLRDAFVNLIRKKRVIP